MNWLVSLPVIAPLAGAGLAVVLNRHPKAQRATSVVVLTVVLAVALILLFAVDDGPLVVNVGGWAAPVGISLVVDRLSALMLSVSITVALCVLLYSLSQRRNEDDTETPVAIYHPTYMTLTAGVAIAFLSGDLFNLYVGFEVLLVSSYVLITMGGTSPRIRAGTTYVVVSVTSSILFLAAVGLVYGAAGTINFAQIAERLPEIDTGIRHALQLLLFIAFAIKAAIFPLSAWLPDSYPTASAPVTAVFAGLLTKVGVYALIRTHTLLFADTGPSMILLVVACLTMVVGVLGAIAQDDVRRILSFHIISQIGYMIFGLALFTIAGIAGAIFYMVHHIVVKTTLFMVGGLIEETTGTSALRRLGGMLRFSPALAVLFLVAAFSLAGIPPLSGFVAKLALLEAGINSGAYLAVAVSVAVSFLTLFSMSKIWNRVFWQSPPEKLPNVKTPRGMRLATGALLAVSLSITVFAAPLFGYIHRTADDLMERQPYIDAVFTEGDRGSGLSTGAVEEDGDGR